MVEQWPLIVLNIAVVAAILKILHKPLEQIQVSSLVGTSV